MNPPEYYVAFAGPELLLQGDLSEVSRTIKTLVDANDPRTPLVFAFPTGEQVDIDLRGTLENVLDFAARQTEPPRRAPGRPKLGVVGREVTLLPRHWGWLNAQPGGASVTLRKLVEQARRDHQGADRLRQSREATFRFMTAIAGNEPGFEEASRALFAGNQDGFFTHIQGWPADVRDFARLLANDVFEGG